MAMRFVRHHLLSHLVRNRELRSTSRVARHVASFENIIFLPHRQFSASGAQQSAPSSHNGYKFVAVEDLFAGDSFSTNAVSSVISGPHQDATDDSIASSVGTIPELDFQKLKSSLKRLLQQNMNSHAKALVKSSLTSAMKLGMRKASSADWIDDPLAVLRLANSLRLDDAGELTSQFNSFYWKYHIPSRSTRQVMLDVKLLESIFARNPSFVVSFYKDMLARDVEPSPKFLSILIPALQDPKYSDVLDLFFAQFPSIWDKKKSFDVKSIVSSLIQTIYAHSLAASGERRFDLLDRRFDDVYRMMKTSGVPFNFEMRCLLVAMALGHPKQLYQSDYDVNKQTHALSVSVAFLNLNADSFQLDQQRIDWLVHIAKKYPNDIKALPLFSAVTLWLKTVVLPFNKSVIEARPIPASAQDGGGAGGAAQSSFPSKPGSSVRNKVVLGYNDDAILFLKCPFSERLVESVARSAKYIHTEFMPDEAILPVDEKKKFANTTCDLIDVCIHIRRPKEAVELLRSCREKKVEISKHKIDRVLRVMSELRQWKEIVAFHESEESVRQNQSLYYAHYVATAFLGLHETLKAHALLVNISSKPRFNLLIPDTLRMVAQRCAKSGQSEAAEELTEIGLRRFGQSFLYDPERKLFYFEGRDLRVDRAFWLTRMKSWDKLDSHLTSVAETAASKSDMFFLNGLAKYLSTINWDFSARLIRKMLALNKPDSSIVLRPTAQVVEGIRLAAVGAGRTAEVEELIREIDAISNTSK